MEPNQLAQARAAFKRAVFILGDQYKMAELLGITRQAVSHRTCRNLAPVLNAEELRLIEEATGVKPHELRPDLYPPEERASATQPAPHPTAQHPAAHPSAPGSSPLSVSGADGSPVSACADGTSPAAAEGDPLKGLAA
jgi:DNA-binding transcriptional regulator YdaS (Cro superfamily)